MPNEKHNPDILSCLANLSNDEVFTPPNIAKQMLDTLPQELFERKDTKFLDPFTKSGVFLREIAIRLIKGLEQEIPDLQERVNHIMQHQIYGIGITELTALLARRTLYCAKNTTSKHSVTTVFEKQNGNIAFDEIQHTWIKDGAKMKCKYCGTSSEILGEDKRENLETHAYQFIHNKNPFKNMKFDVIIGNPPYQLSDGGGTGSSAKPIYHLFIEQAIKMQPHYLCMIVPARWFSGGKGLDNFRNKMLNDKRIRVIVDYIDSNECFNGIDLSGGVCYFLWDKYEEGECQFISINEGVKNKMKRHLLEKGIDTLIRQNQAVPIWRKVQIFNEKSFSNIISSRKPFGLESKVRGHNKINNGVKLHTSAGINFIDEKLIIQNHQWIKEHKVYISKAYGERVSSNFWVTGKPFYGEPNSCCTETYLLIGPFATKKRCENVMSYIRTRFFRFLVLLKKNTQNSSKSTYQFVPMQNFDEEWTDEKLYAKYGLTEEEIAYIESMVRPME